MHFIFWLGQFFVALRRLFIAMASIVKKHQHLGL